MQRTIAIGDIHGCLHSLNTLLDKILPWADTLVFLGDYVDRGPHSMEVVNRLISLQSTLPRMIALRGNHDDMFRRVVEGHDQGIFFQVGGKETLMSYGISENTSFPADCIPTSHRTFFDNLPLYFEDQHAIYVHAGLEPGRHLSMQRAEWCLWAREQFLHSTFHYGKPIVFGHTVFPRPYVSSDKIGIDTGAVYGGQLTALVLPELEFISVPGEQKAPYTNHHSS